MDCDAERMVQKCANIETEFLNSEWARGCNVPYVRKWLFLQVTSSFIDTLGKSRKRSEYQSGKTFGARMNTSFFSTMKQL